MITWLSLAKLEAELGDYVPTGLQLRAFFHARTERDPAALIAHASEELIEDGLDPASAWAGWDDGVPFLIRSAPLLLAGGYGLEVNFPVSTAGDGLLIERLARLPLPPLTSLYFEALAAGLFGVRDVETHSVIYRSASHEDATAVAQFALARIGTAHEVVQCTAVPRRLAVAGPACGCFLSRVELARDQADAARLAEERTRRYAVPFHVIEF